LETTVTERAVGSETGLLIKRRINPFPLVHCLNWTGTLAVWVVTVFLFENIFK
jgi:hypothetical protein